MALALAVAALFLAAERWPEQRPVFAIAVLLQLACAIEVGRMGSLAGRGFTQPLVLALVATAAPAAWAIARGAPFAERGLGAHVLWVLLATWFARALCDFAHAARLPTWVVPAAWVAAVGALAVLGLESGYVLGVFALVAATALVWAARVVPNAARGAPDSSSVGARRSARRPGRDLVTTLALAAWVLVPLSLLPVVWERAGARGMLTLIVLSKVGDIAAYFVGSAIGRHHPFKRLSPGKTTEGCLGSLVAGALAGGCLFWAGWIGGSFARGMLIGAVLNLAAQAGDLLESKVKRSTGVKDSSTALGASGGFLDVLDSLLLTVPTMLLLWPHGF